MEHRTSDARRSERNRGDERRFRPRAEADIAASVNDAEKQARDAARRDERASRRDFAAAERDRVAELRDHEASSLEDSPANASVEKFLDLLRGLRSQAASDRASAAADRRMAAYDRAEAAREREDAAAALRDAHFDDLTGAYRRGFGEQALSGMIEAAHRSGESLALAIVDIDGLKSVNDRDGHLAGDEMLRDLVSAIQANIRPNEPVVRLGGDEFAFAVTGIDCSGIAERCDIVRADLARRPSRGRFTVGAAELRTGSDLSDLLQRADIALVEARIRRSRARGLPR